jgi:hypothetical protein
MVRLRASAMIELVNERSIIKNMRGKKMKPVLKVICLLFGLSTTAWAFMPAGGLWIVDAENNGQAGRGFQIEVENEVMVLTYYGYRADGSSVFYLASGPIVGNSFSGALTEYQNGNALGATWNNPASEVGSAGTVHATFTSGQHGTITFPGETPKTISKLPFGYANGPQGLLGTYLFATIASTTEYTDYYTLSEVTGASTADGNGIVTDSSISFACEYQVSGELNGAVVCVEVTETDFSDSYFFKISGDRGTGVGTWASSSTYYPLHVLRTLTKTGKKTGLNDATLDALSISGIDPSNPSMSSSSISDGTMTKRTSFSDEAKAFETPNDGVPLLDADEQAALKMWADEARVILNSRLNFR